MGTANGRAEAERAGKRLWMVSRFRSFVEPVPVPVFHEIAGDSIRAMTTDGKERSFNARFSGDNEFTLPTGIVPLQDIEMYENPIHRTSAESTSNGRHSERRDSMEGNFDMHTLQKAANAAPPSPSSRAS